MLSAHVSHRKSGSLLFPGPHIRLTNVPKQQNQSPLGPFPHITPRTSCFYINLNISVFWIHILIRSLFLLLSKTVIKLYFCILTRFVKLYTFWRRIKFISHSYFSWSLFFISSASLSFVWASWSSLNRVVTWRFNGSTSLPTCHPGNHKHAFIRG